MSQRMGLWIACLLTNLVVVITLGLVLTPDFAFAGEVVSVFDVRKSLPLDPSDPVYYDYYLNAGPEAGIKKGMFVSVVRKLPIHDPVGNQAQGTLSIEVAKLQVIHVERNLSVARLASEFGSEDRPVLEYEGVMIGDILDLSTVSMDAPKERGKKRSRWPSATETTSTASPAPGTVSIPVGTSPSALDVPVVPSTPASDTSTPVKEKAPASSTLPPSTVENPSRPAPVPDMLRGDDSRHT